MHKLSHQVGNEWLEHSFAPIFAREPATGGAERLIVGVPAGDRDVLLKLLECVEEPLFLLYLLHTPRGEAEPGRYQSPKLTSAEVRAFLARYSSLLANDARHDFWVRSPASDATVVWDRHNVIYAYGPVECFESSLRALGFDKTIPVVPVPHAHHYREEYDTLASEVFTAFQWRQSPLREGDEQ